jgi:hypothetical protein
MFAGRLSAMPYKRVEVRKRRQSVLKIPTDPAILAYAAGLVDGEGCICLRRQYGPKVKGRANGYSLQITIANTKEAMINWLYEHFGALYGVRKCVRYRVMWEWYVCGRQSVQFVEALLPYLVVKREQAQVLIEYLQIGGYYKRGQPFPPAVVERREVLKQRLHVLNARVPLSAGGAA